MDPQLAALQQYFQSIGMLLPPPSFAPHVTGGDNIGQPMMQHPTGAPSGGGGGMGGGMGGAGGGAGSGISKLLGGLNPKKLFGAAMGTNAPQTVPQSMAQPITANPTTGAPSVPTPATTANPNGLAPVGQSGPLPTFANGMALPQPPASFAPPGTVTAAQALPPPQASSPTQQAGPQATGGAPSASTPQAGPQATGAASVPIPTPPGMMNPATGGATLMGPFPPTFGPDQTSSFGPTSMIDPSGGLGLGINNTGTGGMSFADLGGLGGLGLGDLSGGLGDMGLGGLGDFLG